MIETALRFAHILGAIVWVGGQLTVSAVLLPAVRDTLGLEERTELLTAVGRRFASITLVLLLPLQVTTGWLLAVQHGVTWHGLLEPGYSRTLSLKLALFAVVMAAAAGHGIAQARGHRVLSRAASITSLVFSVAVVLVATVLAETDAAHEH